MLPFLGQEHEFGFSHKALPKVGFEKVRSGYSSTNNLF